MVPADDRRMTESRSESHSPSGSRPDLRALIDARAQIEVDELALQRAKRRFMDELAVEQRHARRDVA